MLDEGVPAGVRGYGVGQVTDREPDLTSCCPGCGLKSDDVKAGKPCPTCHCLKEAYHAARPWEVRKAASKR